MRQFSMLYVGLDVHKESIAVASVAQDHGAEVISLGTIGTRQADIDQLIRKRHSRAKHLIFVHEAGPCGSWISRYLSKTGNGCWILAFSPVKAAYQLLCAEAELEHAQGAPGGRVASYLITVSNNECVLVDVLCRLSGHGAMRDNDRARDVFP
jgi:hypothetical protein